MNNTKHNTKLEEHDDPEAHETILYDLIACGCLRLLPRRPSV